MHDILRRPQIAAAELQPNHRGFKQDAEVYLASIPWEREPEAIRDLLADSLAVHVSKRIWPLLARRPGMMWDSFASGFSQDGVIDPWHVYTGIAKRFDDAPAADVERAARIIAPGLQPIIGWIRTDQWRDFTLLAAMRALQIGGRPLQEADPTAWDDVARICIRPFVSHDVDAARYPHGDWPANDHRYHVILRCAERGCDFAHADHGLAQAIGGHDMTLPGVLPVIIDACRFQNPRWIPGLLRTLHDPDADRASACRRSLERLASHPVAAAPDDRATIATVAVDVAAHQPGDDLPFRVLAAIA